MKSGTYAMLPGDAAYSRTIRVASIASPVAAVGSVATPCVPQAGGMSAATAGSPRGVLPLVQFACREAFFEEGDEVAEVPLIRAGNLQVVSVVHYRTVDGSATAGTIFEAREGSITFQPGESEKVITVPLIDDDQWRTTLDFTVELDTSRVTGAVLGQSLCRTVVHILDNDTFPTDKFRDEIDECMQRTVSLHFVKVQAPPFRMIIELTKLMFRDPIIRSGSIKWAFIDLIENSYMLVKLWMQVYLVDVIVQNTLDTAGRARQELAFFFVLNVVIFGFQHFLEYRRLAWRIKGTAKKILQTALMRKFFNFDGASRSGLNHGSLILGMTRDCSDVVERCLLNVLPLLKTCVGIFFIVGYQLAQSLLCGHEFRIESILPLAIFPVVFLLFLWIRWHATVESLAAMHGQMNKLVAHCDSIVEDYSLIVDYDVRGRFLKSFETEIVDFNAIATDTAQVMLNTCRFAPWLALVVSLGYQAWGGMQVVSGELSTGVYLVNIGLFKDFGQKWGEIYNLTLEMLNCVPSLHRLVLLMNMETDFGPRRKLNQHRILMSRQLTVEAMKKVPVGSMAIDALPIRAHPRVLGGSDVADIHQGQLVYFVGPHAQGKSVLLRKIALQSISVDEIQSTFVPSHLRTVFVPNEPLFFLDQTCMENLLFGVGEDEKLAASKRARYLVQRVHLPKSISDLLDGKEAHTWLKQLSHSQRQLLSLVRALTADPEVMCLSKPLQIFDKEAQGRLLQVFREFVHKPEFAGECVNGVARRPRTVILTTTESINMSAADLVLHISAGGVRKVGPDAALRQGGSESSPVRARGAGLELSPQDAWSPASPVFSPTSFAPPLAASALPPSAAAAMAGARTLVVPSKPLV